MYKKNNNILIFFFTIYKKKYNINYTAFNLYDENKKTTGEYCKYIERYYFILFILNNKT